MSANTVNLWQGSLDYIKAQLSTQVSEKQLSTVLSWFQQLVLKEHRDNLLVVGVPSNRFLDIFKERYLRFLQQAVDVRFGTKIAIEFVLDEGISQTEIKSKSAAPVPRLDPQLNSDYTFAHFVQGVSNKAALNVAKAIARKPSQSTFNPLFLYGPSGVGKTHLVTAIGHKIKENLPDKRVLFVSAHLFKTQYTDSIKNNTLNDFMHFYQSIEVLIIDDIQELNTEKTQRTFFHIFNHLQLNGRQIVITCDRPPVLFEGIEERMLTRFKWGMVMEMERPDVALRHDILTAKLRRDGLKFPREVVSYIAENVTDNVRDLQGVVNSIMAYSVVDDCEIDLALTERVVARVVNMTKREITIEDILRTLSKLMGVKSRDILGKGRKADVVAVRQLAMYLAQKYTDMSQAMIGQKLGKRDHATVLHGIRQIEKRLTTDREYRLQVEALEAGLKK